MATLAENYKLMDDPETGERYLVYPDGSWGIVDMKRLNDLADEGVENLPPAKRLLIAFLSG